MIKHGVVLQVNQQSQKSVNRANKTVRTLNMKIWKTWITMILVELGAAKRIARTMRTFSAEVGFSGLNLLTRNHTFRFLCIFKLLGAMDFSHDPKNALTEMKSSVYRAAFK